MTVAELIANELGVKVDEKFMYNNCECIVGDSFLTKDKFGYVLYGCVVNEMLENKDKIVKINSLADSWDVIGKEEYFYITAYGKVDGAIFLKGLLDIDNYNKNKEYMQLIADKQNLFRKMLKFADCNNGEFDVEKRYYIHYTKDDLRWVIGITKYFYETMSIFFSTCDVAEKALEEFRGELEGIRLSEIKLRGITNG